MVVMRVRQIVVQREQHHKREKHPDGAQKMPNIVIVVETEQFAFHVEGPGLCRCFLRLNYLP